VRQIRSELQISPARPIAVLMRTSSPEDRARAERNRIYLERLAGLASLVELRAEDAAPPAATALLGTLEIFVPMEGLIDAAAEADRLAKRLGKAEQDLAKTRAKLANEQFVQHAPTALVVAERERLAELERSAAGVAMQLARVRQLLKP